MKTKSKSPKPSRKAGASINVLSRQLAKSKLPRGTKTARLAAGDVEGAAVSAITKSEKASLRALRRELAALKVRECSERLERETAQRLLKMNADEIGMLRDDIKRLQDHLDWLRREGDAFDRQACVAAGVDLPRWTPPSAQRALVEALGTVQMLRAARDVASEDKHRAEKKAESATESLTKLRTAIRTWAESYFAADDPARAWVLSMLDPVEAKPAAVNLEARSGSYAAAEVKSA